MLLTTAGCAVTRGQSTVGEYVDDAAITTAVKAKMVENKSVDAGAISANHPMSYFTGRPDSFIVGISSGSALR
jgi:hypothetical protein